MNAARLAELRAILHTRIPNKPRTYNVHPTLSTLSMKYATTDPEILNAIYEKAKFGQVFGDGEAKRRGITRLSFKTADEVRARAAALGIQVQE